MWNLVVEIKIWGCGRVRNKKNWWVGWFHPVEWSKLIKKLNGKIWSL
jgi:hypothetical protein